MIHFHANAYVKLVIDLFFNGCIVSHFLIIYQGLTFSAIFSVFITIVCCYFETKFSNMHADTCTLLLWIYDPKHKKSLA